MQAAVPTQRQRLAAALRTDTTAIITLAQTQPGSEDWAHTFFFFFFFWLEESLHAHRCQSCQQPERQIKQTTGELRVHSTSYDKGSCFAMA